MGLHKPLGWLLGSRQPAPHRASAAADVKGAWTHVAEPSAHPCGSLGHTVADVGRHGPLIGLDGHVERDGALDQLYVGRAHPAPADVVPGRAGAARPLPLGRLAAGDDVDVAVAGHGGAEQDAGELVAERQIPDFAAADLRLSNPRGHRALSFPQEPPPLVLLETPAHYLLDGEFGHLGYFAGDGP